MGLSPEQKKRIEERRKEVEKRTKDKETEQQIAEALGVTRVVVKKDRNFLRKQGSLEPLEKKEAEIEERRKEVERRSKNKETIQQIAEALGVTREIVRKDRNFLRKQGRLKTLKEKESEIEERRKEVERRSKNKETIQQIAEALGVTSDVVRKDRDFLKKQGNLRTLKEEQLDEIEKLMKERKTAKQIAEKLEISITTVNRRKKELREQGRLTGKEKTEGIKTRQKKKRMQKLEKMLEETEVEKTREQIGEELGVSAVTVAKDKVRLREQKEQEFAEWSEKIIKLYDGFYGQPKKIKKFEEYLVLCKKRYEQRLLKEEHLLPIKYAAISTETYSNVAFYLKLCIRFSQFEEAMQFAKNYTNCETFSQEEKERIKKSIAECEKFYQAISMMNNSKMDNEAIKKETGLSDVELALLRSKAGKQASGDGKIKSKEKEKTEVRNNWR